MPEDDTGTILDGGEGGEGGDEGPEPIPFDIATMPEELAADPSLATIKTVQDLAKGYVNGQKLVGADKIALPGANADEATLGEFYGKLGRPEAAEGYEFAEPKEDAFFKPDETLVKGFRETAFAAGLSAKQAGALYDWYAQQGEGAMAGIEQGLGEKREAAEKELRAEFGTAFEAKVQVAQEAVRELGGEELAEFMNASRLGDSAPLVKAFAKMGAMMAEDRVEGEGGVRFGTSATEAKAELDALMGNAEHMKAYMSAEHPGHKAAMDKHTRLMQLAYGLDPVSQAPALPG